MRADRIVPLIIAVALFMENMDSTVIATSLPAIAADIGTNPLALKLAVTSYLLSLAIFIPASLVLAAHENQLRDLIRPFPFGLLVTPFAFVARGLNQLRAPVDAIVDDNLDAREMYGMYLAHSGFRWVEAVNGNIKSLIRRARGYRNLHYLLLKAQRMAVTNTEFVVFRKVA